MVHQYHRKGKNSIKLLLPTNGAPHQFVGPLKKLLCLLNRMTVKWRETVTKKRKILLGKYSLWRLVLNGELNQQKDEKERNEIIASITFSGY